MAYFNLLTGAIQGSMGKVTGAKWKNQHVIKSKIEGKAPPTQAQTLALNRYMQAQKMVKLLNDYYGGALQAAPRYESWLSNVLHNNKIIVTPTESLQPELLAGNIPTLPGSITQVRHTPPATSVQVLWNVSPWRSQYPTEQVVGIILRADDYWIQPINLAGNSGTWTRSNIYNGSSRIMYIIALVSQLNNKQLVALGSYWQSSNNGFTPQPLTGGVGAVMGSPEAGTESEQTPAKSKSTRTKK